MTKKKRPSTITALPAQRPIEPAMQGDLMARVATILDQARTNVLRAVNSNMVIAYWLIGREIVQALQGGEDRADYGSRLLAELSESLKRRYGRGFSVTNLKYFRLFFQAYALRTPDIRHEARDELGGINQVAVLDDLSVSLDDAEKLKGFSPNLSWTHYRTLSMVEHRAERLFYEIEAERCNWSQPVLERQIHSHLFARLLKSQDKAGVLKLASEGQTVERPIDMIKHPYVLDFLEIPEAYRLHESELEAALLEKLQPFLLELGKGFAFVARQQRISTESQVTLDEGDIDLPDILTDLQDKTQLTRRSIQRVLVESERLNDFKRNPQQFIELVAEIINRAKRMALVDGIKYQRIGAEDYYAQLLFETEELSGYLKSMIDANKSVHEQVIYQSDTERTFAEQLENNEAIKVYAKLPGWFRVPTPLGPYNPDWAVLVEKDGAERLYFVVETKSSLFTEDLRDKESAKIECGKAHFKALAVGDNPAHYEVVRSVDDLLTKAQV
jgi:type III restriction enzyme